MPMCKRPHKTLQILPNPNDIKSFFNYYIFKPLIFLWWGPQNHWRPWGVEGCQRQLWPGNICQLDYEIYFWFSVLFFLFSLQTLLYGSLGSANAQPCELQTWTVLGCLSLKLRGLMQQWAAISYIRKPVFLQMALTSHDSYRTSKTQFCSCLHPFSFNSYCWFIWGTQFGIWDSFPILKKERKTHFKSSYLADLNSVLHFSLSMPQPSLSISDFQITAEIQTTRIYII